MQVFPQLDREPRDLPRLVPVDLEGRSYRLQRSGTHFFNLLELEGILHIACLAKAAQVLLTAKMHLA